MSWVTFVTLTVLILGQHYLTYPGAWSSAWSYIKTKLGVR